MEFWQRTVVRTGDMALNEGGLKRVSIVRQSIGLKGLQVNGLCLPFLFVAKMIACQHGEQPIQESRVCTYPATC